LIGQWKSSVTYYGVMRVKWLLKDFLVFVSLFEDHKSQNLILDIQPRQLNMVEETKIWGSFSCYGTGPIYRIEKTMNPDLYVHILNTTMLLYAKSEMLLEMGISTR